jgi:hypothetical protein
MALAGRKHSYSKSLGFPILLGNDHSIVRPAWTAHPIRDSRSRTSSQHPATHMLMLHSQPCTGFNTDETTICHPRRPCYMLCVRHFKRLVRLQFKFVKYRIVIFYDLFIYGNTKPHHHVSPWWSTTLR